MMAKLKCSACGAELDKVTFSGGNKQWIFLVLGLLPAVWFFWHFAVGRDFSKDLKLLDVQKNFSGREIVLVGAIHNEGGRRWEHPTLEAEFYAADCKFLGEKSERIDGAVSPRSTEKFSLSMSSIPTEFVPEQGRVEIKITDAQSPVF